MLEWLQSSSLADTISQSQTMMAALSSLHVLGLALIMSAVFGTSLRTLGALFVSTPLSHVSRPATRLLGVGLAISVVTGFLMFMPRAEAAVENQTFRIKLALLSAGTIAYGIAMTRARQDSDVGPAGRILAVTTLTLWIGVVLAGCAFILLE